MSNYIVDESSLTAIGNAIREKTGGTELIPFTDMPNEIASITTGGGSGIEVEPIVLSGNCDYAGAGIVASSYINMFGNTISTSNITNSSKMFYKSTLEKIPFALNLGRTVDTSYSLNGLFDSAINLKELPTLNLLKPISGTSYLFSECRNLRNLPDNFAVDWDWSYLHNTDNKYASLSFTFNNCFSLRSISENFLNNYWGASNNLGYSNYYNGFYNCYVLDEIKGLRFNKSTMTSNMFDSPFDNCARVKDIIFALEGDGSVQTVNCKSQTIDLSIGVGYYTGSNIGYITTYFNSGITADKRVSDDATYQALKDDPDWFSRDINYSRYNHDSAVRTINSLPDTSAYLATAGGTNTIKFKGDSGALTDGGAINTLTEEEIAVATAKGWSVALV